MKFVNEYRDPELGKKLLERIHQRSKKPARLMEFCGGHTVAIFKHGLRQLLPPNIEMLSGPGCPVCVTAAADLDKAIALGKLPGVIITSFRGHGAGAGEPLQPSTGQSGRRGCPHRLFGAGRPGYRQRKPGQKQLSLSASASRPPRPLSPRRSCRRSRKTLKTISSFPCIRSARPS